MNMMPDWVPLSGAAGVEWLAFINKPNITNSNAYLIRTAGEVILIDVGSDPRQADAINAALRGCAGSGRKLIVLISHCHFDHIGAIDKLDFPSDMEAIIAIEASGANAIEGYDREQTLAYLYPPVPLPRARFGARLFGDTDLPFQASTDELQLGPDLSLPRVSIPLAGGLVLEVLHTPGHSPCSLSLRLGSLLFVADIAAGATPGLVGLAGWNQPALVRSLAALERLLEVDGGIVICSAGHGRLMDPAAMVKALNTARCSAEGLQGVCEKNDARITALKAFALEVLSEGKQLFAALVGQVFATHHWLTQLGDEEEAERLLKVLDSDEIEAALADMEAFFDRFNANTDPDLGLVLKASATMQALGQRLREPANLDLIRPTMLRRAISLLDIFLETVRGLDLSIDAAPAEIPVLLAEVVSELDAWSNFDASAAFDAVEDGESFHRFMLARLAAVSAPQKMSLDIQPGIPAAAIHGERFKDVVITLLETLSGGGQRQLDVSVLGAGGTVLVRFRGTPALQASELPDLRRKILERLLGAGVSIEFAAGAVEIKVPALAYAEV